MSQLIFLSNDKNSLYNAYTKEQLLDHPILDYNDLINQPLNYSNVKFIFSTWGMPCLTCEEIKAVLPNLIAVFYAAGSVQAFARPFLECGIKVFSAWAANAIPVAEFTAAQIILANKGYFQLHNRYKNTSHQSVSEFANTFVGNYGAKVGLLGVGMIGKKVIELLKPYNLTISVFDPFLDNEQADNLNVKKDSLENIFTSCNVISNHLANNDKTKGMLDYNLFSVMLDNATFINTGRGAQVVAKDLIRAMKEVNTRTALLDVTDPTEPLNPNDELFKCENIFISPHRAGSAVEEIKRMGDYMFTEYHKLINNKETEYMVSLKMLETMA